MPFCWFIVVGIDCGCLWVLYVWSVWLGGLLYAAVYECCTCGLSDWVVCFMRLSVSVVFVVCLTGWSALCGCLWVLYLWSVWLDGLLYAAVYECCTCGLSDWVVCFMRLSVSVVLMVCLTGWSALCGCVWVLYLWSVWLGGLLYVAVCECCTCGLSDWMRHVAAAAVSSGVFVVVRQNFKSSWFIRPSITQSRPWPWP